MEVSPGGTAREQPWRGDARKLAAMKQSPRAPPCQM
ncbi:hypothetical protein SAMN05443639_11034 [Stigmatella erecta]|uniref:Uncharacterized protein n=1 Tax=Stigmatella erecta TaxID=83460 RepID=A0A1I0KBP7_9BACT|nr:hypothetical protein SAMN05443639_11034 [Stigmatella erecta]